MYGVYTVFLAGDSPYYGHIRCSYTVLANPSYTLNSAVYKECVQRTDGASHTQEKYTAVYMERVHRTDGASHT